MEGSKRYKQQSDPPSRLSSPTTSTQHRHRLPCDHRRLSNSELVTVSLFRSVNSGFFYEYNISAVTDLRPHFFMLQAFCDLFLVILQGVLKNEDERRRENFGVFCDVILLSVKNEPYLM
ncbi:unnamed protein product [Vicia faba]|uniref:Uncharacterized protein n=1 Tax=Vicia faba TaxID=3906 RepID=A0AAV1AIF4_VICFA|nr:unnamed protein product [Vicia faba]